MEQKNKIYEGLTVTFSVIVVLSNILSAKMVLLPLFPFAIPLGLITYPLTFLLSDLVTELFGYERAKQMVITAFMMNLMSLAMIQFGLLMPGDNLETENSFQMILGLSGLRIFASLSAYLISQLIDVKLYALIRAWTNDRYLWLRNNGSTCVSQLVDTLLIDIIYLFWGMGMTMEAVAPIMLFSYLYKAAFSFALTPLFYSLVFFFKKNGRGVASAIAKN